MSNNESHLWDKKYSSKSKYKTKEDFFYFARNNPTIKELNHYIFDGAKVLEIGSGTGELISFLSSNYNIQAFGVDYSNESIRISNDLVSKFIFPVIFKNENIENLSFSSDYFDIIYGDQVVGHIPDLEKALSEIYRVLKPGGVCLLSTSNKLRFDGWDFYKKISDNHQGYTQNSFYPWTFKNILINSGFKFVGGYGDMIILMRNLDVIKNKIFLKNSENSKKITNKQNKTRLNFKEKGILRKLYNKLNLLMPWWFKISIGIIIKK